MVVCIKELKQLPPLSNSAREILKIAYNDDIDISVFTKIVERDPALLAKLIGLANSAYFGNRSLSDVHRAIVDVLGLRTAKNIAMGLVLGGVFNPRQCRRFQLPKYWFLSLLTATLAKEFCLCANDDKIDPNDAYLSGMLNEIGLMALAYLHPEEMEEIMLHEDDEARMYEAEMEFFGQSHYAISTQLLESWRLPNIVCQIMGQSAPDLTEEECVLCQIIKFSRKIARNIYEQLPIELTDCQPPSVIAEQSDRINSIINNANTQNEAYREMANLLS